MSSTSRDSWERLVAAVLKREQIWQLCHAHSRSPSISTIASDSTSDFSEQIPNNSSKPASISPHPKVPLGQLSLSLVSKPKGEKDEYLVDVPEDLRIHLQRVRIFSLHELQVATENFSDKNVLGHGYNMVYKGWLVDGSPVVVKRYKSPYAELPFWTELEINSIAMHPNVLHVLGLCFSPKERLLVHPLMVNDSVASWLWGRHIPQAPLHWPIRKRIALGAARGLAYLHYECDKKIIHRDVKAANILLDEDFEAVIADFEFAKLMDCDDTEITTAIRGTRGRIAPEYLAAGKCSERADVFSYGVFLLELISGQRTFHLYQLAQDEDKKLLDWVKSNYKERKWEVMVGADCGGNYMGEIVELLMQIAILCTQDTPERRPKMSEIVKMLEDGDGLAEIWEEWYKKEVEKENDSSKNNLNSDTIYKQEDGKENDSLENHPSSDWTIYDDTSNPAAEELSGPR